MSQSNYSMISKCIRNKKALEDDNELFVTEQPNPNKWAKKVQVLYKGNDGKLKFHEQDCVDPDIKEMELMEYQADLKEKKGKKKEYKNGMRAGFNLAMGQIDSPVKQDCQPEQTGRRFRRTTCWLIY